MTTARSARDRGPAWAGPPTVADWPPSSGSTRTTSSRRSPATRATAPCRSTPRPPRTASPGRDARRRAEHARGRLRGVDDLMSLSPARPAPAPRAADPGAAVLRRADPAADRRAGRRHADAGLAPITRTLTRLREDSPRRRDAHVGGSVLAPADLEPVVSLPAQVRAPRPRRRRRARPAAARALGVGRELGGRGLASLTSAQSAPRLRHDHRRRGPGAGERVGDGSGSICSTTRSRSRRPGADTATACRRAYRTRSATGRGWRQYPAGEPSIEQLAIEGGPGPRGRGAPVTGSGQVVGPSRAAPPTVGTYKDYPFPESATPGAPSETCGRCAGSLVGPAASGRDAGPAATAGRAEGGLRVDRQTWRCRAAAARTAAGWAPSRPGASSRRRGTRPDPDRD